MSSTPRPASSSQPARPYGGAQADTPWAASWLKWMNLTQWAPNTLNQPINPGWSFGNVIVNNSNSSAPGMEMALVARHSYGRQIGRLIGVVQELVAKSKLSETLDAVQDFHTLCEELDEARQAHQQERLTRLREELQALQQSDPALWAELVKPAKPPRG